MTDIRVLYHSARIRNHPGCHLELGQLIPAVDPLAASLADQLEWNGPTGAFGLGIAARQAGNNRENSVDRQRHAPRLKR